MYENKEELEKVILVAVSTGNEEDAQESLDELEELVTEIEPTAEFNRTMAAEEYRQSLSTTENYSKNYVDTDEDDEELE